MGNLKEWCFSKHREINHKYDGYLPYEFHLNMTYYVFLEFSYLLDDVKPINENSEHNMTEKFVCEVSTFGHDLLEDTHCSYNDIVSVLGNEIADVIYALTNEKGRNRNERANEKYYEGIRNTQCAVFVKLCDRIANVMYSKMTHSSMFYLYKNENEQFLSKLQIPIKYEPMIQRLETLFRDKK